MFEKFTKLLKKFNKKEENKVISSTSKNAAKERLHLVLMQDRANVSADFLELMKQEIIDVIKKYIDVDESAIDVRLTNKENEDGTNGAPALYANIPILNIKNEARKMEVSKENSDIENTNDSTPNKEENKIEPKENKIEDKIENIIEENVQNKENDKNEEVKEEEKTENKENQPVEKEKE